MLRELAGSERVEVGDEAGGRPVADAPSASRGRPLPGHRSQRRRAPPAQSTSCDDRLLGLAGHGDVESALECLDGTDRRVRAAGDQQRGPPAQPLDQPVGVPDPAGEERRTPMTSGANASASASIHVGVVLEVPRGGVDDADLAPAREQRRRDVLQAEQRRAERARATAG